MTAPFILEIKGNSLDDGPGIRTSLFLKGCPLRCIWCHNPESKHFKQELSFDAAKCIGCGTCIRECTNHALDLQNPRFIDRTVCSLCFSCANACPSKALSCVGFTMLLSPNLQKNAA